MPTVGLIKSTVMIIITCPRYIKLKAQGSYANHQVEDHITRPEDNQLDIVVGSWIKCSKRKNNAPRNL